MSTYVIGDVHGCYKEFLEMLKQIDNKDEDRIIMVGDYIDRGDRSFEMLEYMENAPENLQMIRGNHEEEFIYYVELMLSADKANDLESDYNSNADTYALYDATAYWIKKTGNEEAAVYFDVYKTIRRMITENGADMDDLIRWARIMKKMPYFVKTECGGKPCIIVHAGYKEGLSGEEAEGFYLYARDESIKEGGIRGGVIIAGHTPTVLEDEFAYTGGTVFKHYDPEKDTTFFNIDCGCVFKEKYPEGALACIRLEDEAVFYV